MIALRLPRAVLAFALFALVAGGAQVGAQDIEDLRDQREQNRRDAASVAGEIDALSAEDQELVDALAALDAHIALQEAKVASAEAAISEAEEAAADAQARAVAIDADMEVIRARLRQRAVEAYVAPRLDVVDQLNSDDLLEAALRQSFLDEVVGDEYDLVDQLRAAESEQQASRRLAEEAAADAEVQRRELQARLDELAASRGEAEELRDQVQTRIAEWQAVGSQIEAADAAIADEIRRLEEEAARLAAAAEARREAEEEAARIAAEEAAREAAGEGDEETEAGEGEEPSVEPPAGGFAVAHRPVPGIITSGFGSRVHPIFGTVRQHYGLDLNGNTGDPIVAVAAGTVIWSGERSGYGNTIVLSHGNGFTTLYAHQSVLSVSAGATVAGGDTIGRVGSTGWSTGPHLHFEIRVEGVAVDPAPYL